jgi:hypothetical protein
MSRSELAVIEPDRFQLAWPAAARDAEGPDPDLARAIQVRAHPVQLRPRPDAVAGLVR